MSDCQKLLRQNGLPYSRTCSRCGLRGQCEFKHTFRPNPAPVVLPCNIELIAAGQAYPKVCATCGIEGQCPNAALQQPLLSQAIESMAELMEPPVDFVQELRNMFALKQATRFTHVRDWILADYLSDRLDAFLDSASLQQTAQQQARLKPRTPQ